MRTHPLKNSAITSAMTNVKFPSWIGHFNKSPGPIISTAYTIPLKCVKSNSFIPSKLVSLSSYYTPVCFFALIFLSLIILLHPSGILHLFSHLPRLRPSLLYCSITSLGPVSHFCCSKVHLWWELPRYTSSGCRVCLLFKIIPSLLFLRTHTVWWF